MWTNVLFDFAPIMVIIYFHHRSFRFDNQQDARNSEVQQEEDNMLGEYEGELSEEANRLPGADARQTV